MTWVKENQQKIAIAIGYVLVFLLAFGLGRITVSIPNPPEIRIEEQNALQDNNSANGSGIQTQTVETSTNSPQAGVAGASFAPIDGQCSGKIKGNMGSSGKIYHVPGGSFYDRTDAEECFEVEAAAQVAGYRKSSR